MGYQSQSKSSSSSRKYWADRKAAGGIDGISTAAPPRTRKPIARFDPSAHQAAYFDWITNGTGNAVVEAVAGSGKTTTLLHGGSRMAGSVIYLAYNKKIAEEIDSKLFDFSLDDRAQAKTFHAIAFQAWRRIARGVKLEGRNLDNKIEDLKIPPLFAGFTKSAVSLAKQWGIGLGGERLDHRPSWDKLVDHFQLEDNLKGDNGGSYSGDGEILDIAIEYSIELLTATIADGHRTMDFDDMIYLPLLHGAHFDRFDWVLVDEAQDSNPTRREIAKRLMHRDSRAVFVGDPGQAIYGFTGANSDALEIIKSDFSATTLPLTITYRCPKAIVEVAHRYVSHIQAADTAPEGHHEFMAEEEFRALGRVELNASMAILCRNTKPLVTMAYDLIIRDIPCHVEGREIGHSLIRIIDMFPKARALQSLIDEISNYRTEQVAKLMAKNKGAAAEAIDDRCDALVAIAERMPTSSTAADLKQKISALFDDTPDGQNSKNLTLSTIHKSKGREWPTVYWIGANRYQPSKYATLEWQLEQETNLCYVAATRAMDKLVEVDL